jgi:hypothetical protein
LNIARPYFVVPELAGALGAGALLAPLPAGLVVLLLEEPLWPEVAPLAASFMHCSFSVPVRCAHLVSLAPAAALPLASFEVLESLEVLPLAPVEVLDSFLSSLLVLAPAPAEPLVVVEVLLSLLVLPEALDEGLSLLVLPDALDSGLSLLVLAPAAAEPLVEVEGVLSALVEVEGVLCELVLPLAAPRSRRQRSFSAAIMLSQLLLAMPPAAVPAGPLVCAPVVPDVLWAKEALDSARSAAAVALARTFRFI